MHATFRAGTSYLSCVSTVTYKNQNALPSLLLFSISKRKHFLTYYTEFFGNRDTISKRMLLCEKINRKCRTSFLIQLSVFQKIEFENLFGTYEHS